MTTDETPGITPIRRTARVTWLAHPPHGHGRVAVGERAFTALPLSFAGEHNARQVTTPGELLAAAHASAVTLILARMLEDSGTGARELTVGCDYVYVSDWFAIASIAFDVHGRVDGIDSAAFTQTVRAAIDRCATSLGLQDSSRATVMVDLM